MAERSTALYCGVGGHETTLGGRRLSETTPLGGRRLTKAAPGDALNCRQEDAPDGLNCKQKADAELTGSRHGSARVRISAWQAQL